MARLSVGLFILGCLVFSPSLWAQSGVNAGIVTANNVDITTDTGEILPERLHVGDSIFVVANPGKVRKGWVRVSRSVDDTIGIGWIEEKNVRTYQRWGGGAAPAPAPAVESGPDFMDMSLGEADWEGGEDAALDMAVGEKRVAVLAFSAANPKDKFVTSARKHFINTLKKNGDFELNAKITGKGVNSDSESALKGLLTKNKLDGVFVGSVSPPIGGARLVKVKYFSKRDGTFATEKVKRVSSEAGLASAMSELVKSCVEEIAAF